MAHDPEGPHSANLAISLFDLNSFHVIVGAHTAQLDMGKEGDRVMGAANRSRGGGAAGGGGKKKKSAMPDVLVFISLPCNRTRVAVDVGQRIMAVVSYRSLSWVTKRGRQLPAFPASSLHSLASGITAFSLSPMQVKLTRADDGGYLVFHRVFIFCLWVFLCLRRLRPPRLLLPNLFFLLLSQTNSSNTTTWQRPRRRSCRSSWTAGTCFYGAMAHAT